MTPSQEPHEVLSECGFCGYEITDSESELSVLQQTHRHILKCEKHPMRDALRAAERLVSYVLSRCDDSHFVREVKLANRAHAYIEARGNGSVDQ